VFGYLQFNGFLRNRDSFISLSIFVFGYLQLTVFLRNKKTILERYKKDGKSNRFRLDFIVFEGKRIT
jgi:hypothetical protein